MNSRSASIVGDQEAGGSSSYAWCNRQWLSSQAFTRRSSVRPKQAVFNHNLLWLPESNGYPLRPNCSQVVPKSWGEPLRWHNLFERNEFSGSLSALGFSRSRATSVGPGNL